MAPDIGRGHLQLAIYQTGLMYAILKESRAIADSCRADRAMMADIHTRLEETFALTAEQRVCLQFFFLFTIMTAIISRQTFVLLLESCSSIPTVCVIPNCMLMLRYYLYLWTTNANRLTEIHIYRSRSVRSRRSSASSIYLVIWLVNVLSQPVYGVLVQVCEMHTESR